MIVCSISTIPHRTQGFLQVLDSIRQQTQLPDKVFITIPQYYQRIQMTYPEEDMTSLKTFLDEFPIETEIVRPAKDIGPCVKLTTPIQKGICGSDDVIIILDDDTLIFPETIELLLKSYKRFGPAVYGFIGVMDERPTFFYHGEQVIGYDAADIDMLGGYRGVLYPAHLIHTDIEQWVDMFVKEHEQEGLMAMHDDHIFTYYLKQKQIPRRIVKIPISFPDECKYKFINNSNGIFGSSDGHKSLMKTVEIYNQILGKKIN